MNADSGVMVVSRGNPLSQWIFRLIDEQRNACDQFMEEQRKRIILGNPTSQQLAEHRNTLKWMLRMMRLLHSEVADPDFPVREYAAEVEGRVIQLEECWQLLYGSKMSDAEAEKILSAAFPG